MDAWRKIHLVRKRLLGVVNLVFLALPCATLQKVRQFFERVPVIR
jgi:hypothetical protein